MLYCYVIVQKIFNRFSNSESKIKKIDQPAINL